MTEWFEEDPELVGLLVSWDEPSLSADLSNRSPPLSPLNVTHRRGTQRTINITRERRKHELEFLRNKATALETQLHKLRHRREVQLRPHFVDPKCTQYATVAPIWEKMTIRQFQARKRSELYNANLKRMLVAQHRVAEDLVRAIQVMEQRSRSATPFVSTPLQICGDVKLELCEQDQLPQLELLCGRWTSEIERFHDCNSLQFVDTQVADVKDHEVVVEVCSSSVLPFSVERIEEVLWTLYRRGWGDDNDGESCVQEASVTDDLIDATFMKVMSLDTPHRGSIKGRSVTKRFHPTSTEMGFVTLSQSTSQGFGYPLDGCRTVEESWVRVVDAKQVGHTELVGILTVIQRVHRERIELNKSIQMESVDMESVTSIVMNRIRRELELIQQGMEDILMSVSSLVKIENQ